MRPDHTFARPGAVRRGHLLNTARCAAAAIFLATAPVRVRALSAQAAPMAAARPNSLPDHLSDADFWKVETDISEPGGYFQITDNYTSNEIEVGRVMTMLRLAHDTGGVYIGVGPEQNLSYIAAIRPRMAFVIDIRRQAVMQHLMYKAIFEMAKDRADFISLLFSKPRPPGLTDSTDIQKMWDAYWNVPTDLVQGPKNYTRIVDNLTKTHGFTFSADEAAQLRDVWTAFYEIGPVIQTRATQNGGRGGGANSGGFADMTGYAPDDQGIIQSFLSTEDNYRYVKMLEDKNLVMPVSGDFAGPKALRAIGKYIADHGATVTAYYVSNVEQYLFQDGKQNEFYANVATLPVTSASVFIRPYSLRPQTAGPPLCPVTAFLRAWTGNRVYGYNATTACVP